MSKGKSYIFNNWKEFFIDRAKALVLDIGFSIFAIVVAIAASYLIRGILL